MEHRFSGQTSQTHWLQFRSSSWSDRFAIGDFSSNPKAFWPASGPPPPNSFDPVDIRVFESTPGHLEADVTLDTAGVQSITASFAETAAQIAAGIEGADWIEGARTDSGR